MVAALVCSLAYAAYICQRLCITGATRYAIERSRCSSLDGDRHAPSASGGHDDCVVAALALRLACLPSRRELLARQGDDVVGVSLRAMAAELASQFVVLLYLVDNESTLLVTGPQLVSVVLLVWKVTKVKRAQRQQLEHEFCADSGEDEAQLMHKKHSLRLLKETQHADSLATSHMLFILAPLTAGYAVYSLLYVPHTGWYAWLLESVTTTVYALGFIFMLPQLVINYRLQSVAHLQWRLLVYRALNTFIDDLFAFVIKMPTLHRISCFRDDIVFVVYLYQRWVYPVDVQRPGDVADGASSLKKDALNKPHDE